MVPKAELFITTQVTAMPSWAAVARQEGCTPKPPSPVRVMQMRSGAASLPPSTAEAPKPMLARPEVWWMEPGTVMSNCWATPFLFQPTSVKIRASSGMTSFTSFRMRWGVMGKRLSLEMASLDFLKSALAWRIFSRRPGRCLPWGQIFFTSSRSWVRPIFRSPTAPISTG